MADQTITQGPQAAVPDARDAEMADLRRRLEAAEHFPDQNPHPVLRMDAGGVLLYANPASRGLLRELGLDVGGRVPTELLAPLEQVLEAGEGMAEAQVGRRTYCFKPVASPEFGFINVYAIDISAAKAVERCGRELSVPRDQELVVPRGALHVTKALADRAALSALRRPPSTAPHLSFLLNTCGTRPP